MPRPAASRRRGRSRALHPTRRAQLFLLGSVILTVALYAVPYGWLVAYPLMLLSTVSHEMGHGLAALLVGGRFDALYVWPDGSGMASWQAATGRLGRAMVAAGGLLGPAVAAAICFASGRRAQPARGTLLTVAALLTIALVLVVRSLFGWLFVALLAAVLALLGLYGDDWLVQGSLLFLGVQLALSVFSRGDYLFTPVARTAQGDLPSDVAHIAAALVLPFWFWGTLCAGLSLAVVGAGIAPFFRRG